MQKYKSMVSKLAKRGEEILNTLTPDLCHIWHMIAGLSGEGYEFREACFDGERKKVIKELGDILFYLEGLSQSNILNCDIWDHNIPLNSSNNILNDHLMASPMEAVLYLIGKISDETKKLIIYQNIEKVEEVKIYILGLVYEIKRFCIYFQTDIETVAEENMNKLIGRNGRYKSGEYSDEQAKTRT